MEKIKIEIKWAFIFIISLLVWMLLEKTLGWHDEKIADHFWLTFLFIPFAFLMYVLALREKRRRHYNNQMTWFQGFKCGLLISIFIALLSPLAQYITHNYITPEFFNNVIEYSVTNELMTLEKANAYFNLNSYMWQSAIGALIMGTLTSAVAALFMRRK